MLAETLIGVAIVAAVIFTVCVVRALLPGPGRTPGVERLRVLRCSGEAVGLEAAARESGPYERLYILDDGMTPEALRRARILADRRGALIITKDEISEGTRDADGR